MSVEKMSETQVSRRAIAKGAAWTLPVVATGAAAPMASASVPPCPTCLTAGAGGVFTAQWAGVLGLGAVVGTEAFNLDASGCSLSLFQPTYTVAGLGGSMTWSDGTSSVIGAAAIGGGTIGQISAVSGSYTTADVRLPNGFYGGTQGKHPKKVCFYVDMYFMALGAIPLPACSYTICYDICGIIGAGVVALGTGTINWTGTLCNGTVTPGHP